MSGFGNYFLRQHYATVAGLGDKLGAMRAFFAGAGQPPHIITGLFERVDLLPRSSIGIDCDLQMIYISDRCRPI
jgi:hypothetical protein